MTLNEKNGAVTAVEEGQDVERHGYVWRAEPRCQGDDVNMVKLTMEFHAQWKEG